MAKNLIYDRANRVVVVASAARTSGQPLREEGWNGVAMTSAANGESLTLVTAGVAEFVLAGVTKGALVYITAANALTLTSAGNTLFGKAVTASASGTNKFRVAILNTL